MKEKARSIFAVLLMALFVNFVFSNIVFTHTHNDSQYGAVTHSHPYLPSSGHTHSHNSLDQIAGFNTAVAAFQGTAVQEIAVAECPSVLLEWVYKPISVSVNKSILSLRAPPAGLLFQ